MGIIPVTFYKGECDYVGCKADPMDDSEYSSWAEPSQVVEDAQNADWYTHVTEHGVQVLLCYEHAPVCACPGCDACKTYPEGNCKVRLRDGEFGTHCEDCFLEIDPKEVALA
jgi:hypothetical protein